MRISWEVIECQQVTLMAQYIETETERTFRPFNPDRKLVPWGQNNETRQTISCSMICCCCYLMEMFFKKEIKELINIIKPGAHSAEDLFF